MQMREQGNNCIVIFMLSHIRVIIPTQPFLLNCYLVSLHMWSIHSHNTSHCMPFRQQATLGEQFVPSTSIARIFILAVELTTWVSSTGLSHAHVKKSSKVTGNISMRRQPIA